MTIFRGAGGGGDATTDSEVNLLTSLATTSSTHAANAAASASAADSSATAAASSASEAAASASTASTQATNASNSATDAASSASAASTSATNAATSASEAAASAASIDPATLVKLTGNQTIAGVKTFSSTVQGSVSGTAANVTGTVAVANGGTGATTAVGAPFALKGDNSDITSLTALASVNSGQLAGLRNKIINGKMEIAQRGTSFAGVGISSGIFPVDRFALTGSASSAVFTASQSTDVPSLNQFQNSARLEVTTADAAVAAGDHAALEQKIEGYNIRDLLLRTFVMSFWVRSSKTGEHCVAFFNSGLDRSYVATYTINVANTWEFKTVTVTGGLPNAGTWNWTGGVGLFVRWTLNAGTNYHTTANAWQTGLLLSTANQVNCLDTIGNIFAITGVQLEVGSVATPFEHRPYGAELALCHRYYFRTIGSSGPIGPGMVNTTTTALLSLAFPVPMRSAPSALEQSGTATDYRLRTSGGTLTTCSAAPSYVNATNGSAMVQFNVASGLTAGQAAIAESINANSYLGFSAEL